MEAPTRGRPEAVDAVKVVVRVRPLNAKERQEQTKSCVRIASSPDGLSSNNRPDTGGGPQQLIVGKDRAFTFDEVFGIDSSQQDVYKNNVEALVDCFLEGYNATVLAYGQTGTGKTHTMSGSGVDPKGGGKSDDLQGIIPRVIRAIFEKMQTNQQRREYSLRVEYIEIYNEELRDLLHPETPSKQLSIREDAEGNIIMAGVKSETAQSREAVLRLLALGGASRVTGSTMMNEQSSRSHAIFSLIVQQRDLATDERRKAKFHLVDLAGSERAKRTGAVAGRFKESISINQGLLALGNVISALSDEKRKLGATDKPGTSSGGGVHVPYRDSKLTRLLQDSLGGNAKTLMIACVSPATINFEETLNTLKYANRAKNIKNRPIVNQQTQEEKQRADDEIARMKEEIALLQSQLHSTKPPATPSTAGGSSSRPETASSSSSSRSRRHSVAVSTSTSTTTMGPDPAATEQELVHLRKKCRAYADTIETMRGLNVEAITSLIAMEREIKPLGRPVQHQLNEIVKTLNAAVQAVGSVESSLRKSLSVVPGGGGADMASHTDAYERVAKELKEAKANLARDEEIFEMKNAEIKRLQTFVAEAKVKNEKLIERVQELERSGQLWANQGPATSATVVHPTRLTSPKEVTPRRPRQDEPSSAAVPPLPTSSMDAVPSGTDVVDAKRSSSSRGLFTKRAGTAMAYAAPQEDNVLIGNEDDDNDEHNTKKPSTASRRSVTSPRGGHSDSRTATRESLVADDHHKHSGAVAKMEKMLATLRGKVDELQQQNSELQHGREEALRRWQLERQQYERAAGEAEQTIEALRAAKQALEDALIEDAPGETRPNVRGSQQRQQQWPQRTAASEIVMDEHGEMIGGRRLATASPPVDAGALFDASVRRLMEYNQARDQVLRLVQDKKAAQQSVDAASKRLNALEMQKLRQSLSLRESIADAARSLRGLDASMQCGDAEQQSAVALERLAKLRHRAERKLAALRRQEARGEFLDKDAQHEAADLEELIEDLNSRIAFQDAELAAARDEMALARPPEQPNPLDALALAAVEALGLKTVSTTESAAVAFVKKCLDDVARLRAREQELRAELSACAATLSERDAALAQLEAALEASRREFDRRLQLQRQEAQDAVAALERENARLAHAQKDAHALEPEQPEQSERVQDEEWRKLIVSCQKKDAYITDLEKHVVFYKAKAKQMQGQLQQLIRDSAGNQGDDHAHDDAEQQQQLQRRVQQLEAANDALMKDLAAAKVYLQLAKSRGSHDGAHVVRVSKSELRELPRRPPTAAASRDDEEYLGRSHNG